MCLLGSTIAACRSAAVWVHFLGVSPELEQAMRVFHGTLRCFCVLVVGQKLELDASETGSNDLASAVMAGVQELMDVLPQSVHVVASHMVSAGARMGPLVGQLGELLLWASVLATRLHLEARTTLACLGAWKEVRSIKPATAPPFDLQVALFLLEPSELDGTMTPRLREHLATQLQVPLPWICEWNEGIAVLQNSVTASDTFSLALFELPVPKPIKNCSLVDGSTINCFVLALASDHLSHCVTSVNDWMFKVLRGCHGNTGLETSPHPKLYELFSAYIEVCLKSMTPLVMSEITGIIVALLGVYESRKLESTSLVGVTASLYLAIEYSSRLREASPFPLAFDVCQLTELPLRYMYLELKQALARSIDDPAAWARFESKILSAWPELDLENVVPQLGLNTLQCWNAPGSFVISPKTTGMFYHALRDHIFCPCF